MIYKIGILGASGRMGLEVASMLSEGFSDGKDMLELGDCVAQSKRLTSVEGVPVREPHEPPWEPVHAWIDFSRPAATMALLRAIEAPIVIATTGFTDDELGAIREYATRHPVMLAPNTSPGMNLMLWLLRHVPPAFRAGFDVVVEEAHHNRKKDSPSGTAKALLGALESIGVTSPPVNVIRAGGIPGDHSVRFVAESEEVALSHRVWDRKVFARGAIRAALFLLRRNKPGMYTMQDLFEQE